MKEELTGKRIGISGQGVLEILIALAILTITLSAAILVVYGGQSLLLDTRLGNQALNIAREKLENAEDIGRNDFNSLASTSSASGIFSGTLTVTAVNTSTKQVISRVSWSVDPLRVQKVELKTLVTNWVPPVPLFGDWQNPLSKGTIDLGPGNSGTGVRVRNRIVYITSTASDSKKPDFYVIDATDPGNPTIIFSTSTGSGADAVAIGGNYAYIANHDSSGQLQIINVANPASSYLVKTYQIPGLANSAYIKKLTVSNNIAYVVTEKNAGPEFYTIDVSNPATPVLLGTFEINDNANGIRVDGTTAYVAVANSSAEMKTINVSNLSAPSLMSNFNATGTLSGYSLSLIPASSTMFLGRAQGTGPELVVVNVSNPAGMTLISNTEIGANILGLKAVNYLVFLLTDDANNEFKVYNISNLSNIVFWSELNFPQAPNDIDYERNTLYVAVRSNDALRIITSTR
ncbi:MAG: beta-propeller domain-containing protein [Patescibacteria group bacterium]